MSMIQIKADRLMSDLDRLRSFGKQGKGVVRPAYSEADIDARSWLVGRMQEAGLEVHVDSLGNVFGLPPTEAPCLLIGSHSDSQPEGGWLDGAYGVIAALEVARASLEVGRPAIACVSFQDEEGRFSTLTGSRVWTGQLSLEEADCHVDTSGFTLAKARKERGRLPTASDVSPHRFRAFLEAHIEQGPVLHQSGDRIGVVENIVGIRTMMMRFTGEQNHAGTTPMHLRRDAVRALLHFASEVDTRLADIATPSTVWTLGHINVHPNAVSIVPGQVDFSLQWRDAEEERLDQMHEAILETAANAAERLKIDWEVTSHSAIKPTQCDTTLVTALCEAAEASAPGLWRRMPSGALHDAANLSSLMPTAMLFVPSINGISHSFDEDTDRADLVLGAEVLANAASRI